jgi:hypothetical protein
MDDLVLQLGVGGIFAVLLIKLVLDWLKPIIDKKLATEPSPPAKADPDKDAIAELVAAVGRMEKKIDTLHEWHNVRGQDGRLLWYYPSSLDKAIGDLAKNIEAQTEILRNLGLMVRDSCATMERIEKRLDREGR